MKKSRGWNLCLVECRGGTEALTDHSTRSVANSCQCHEISDQL